ncbi:MAG: hypothetical protein KGJ86_06380 [Chloroflexota bacterium]|nr:hypothetical protein [Chloroflexota bacterium]
MALRNVRVDVISSGKRLARGVCMLVSPGRPERGTISQLRWSGAEPNLTGSYVSLHLADGEHLLANVVRHSHDDGLSVLRFQVAS